MTSDVITLYIKKIRINNAKIGKYFLILHQYITDPTKITRDPKWYSPFAMKLKEVPWTPLYIHIYQKTLTATNYIGSIPLPLSTMSLNKYYKQTWSSPTFKFTLNISFLIKDSDYDPEKVESVTLYDPELDMYLRDMAMELPNPDDRCPYEV